MTVPVLKLRWKKEEPMLKPTLLYAEDDQESRENYAFILKPFFSDIFLASNGKDALDLYYEKQPDIMLLDISMPLLNGIELAKHIRKDDPNTSIIMLSAHSDREILLEAVGLKLEAYLIKPVDDVQLNETIEKLIRETRADTTIPIRENLVWDRNNANLLYKDQELKITKKERLMLQVLTRQAEKYVSHDELIFHIWPDEIPDHSHNNKLIQLIYRFNKKIMEETSSDIHLVENTYTLGYKLNCQ
jgi:DNA-binding response OmpR family regulator